MHGRQSVKAWREVTRDAPHVQFISAVKQDVFRTLVSQIRKSDIEVPGSFVQFVREPLETDPVPEEDEEATPAAPEDEEAPVPGVEVSLPQMIKIASDIIMDDNMCKSTVGGTLANSAKV